MLGTGQNRSAGPRHRHAAADDDVLAGNDGARLADRCRHCGGGGPGQRAVVEAFTRGEAVAVAGSTKDVQVRAVDRIGSAPASGHHRVPGGPAGAIAGAGRNRQQYVVVRPVSEVPSPVTRPPATTMRAPAPDPTNPPTGSMRPAGRPLLSRRQLLVVAHNVYVVGVLALPPGVATLGLPR